MAIEVGHEVSYEEVARKLNEIVQMLPATPEVPLGYDEHGTLTAKGSRPALIRHLVELAEIVATQIEPDLNKPIDWSTEPQQGTPNVRFFITTNEAESTTAFREKWWVSLLGIASMIGCLGIIAVFILGLIRLTELLSSG